MSFIRSTKALFVAAAVPMALVLQGCGRAHTATCESNADCGSTLYECLGGICVLRECTTNADCDQSIGEFCHQDICSQFCASDEQCGEGNFCVSNVCFSGCDSNSDCDQDNGFICDVIPDHPNNEKSCLPGTASGDCLSGEDHKCLRCATDDEQSCAACEQGYEVNVFGACQAICGEGEGWVQGHCCPTTQIPLEHWVIVGGVCTPVC